jgi:hypothetical protein
MAGGLAGMDLSKPVGPLPLGAWIAVVGGGLGIAWYSKRAGTGTVTPTIVEDTGMGNPDVGAGGSWLAVPPPTSAPPGNAAPATNEEWGRLAINWLIAQGYDPATSDSAIRKYLETQSLDTREYALLQSALRQFGSPPIPLPSPPPAPSIPPPVVITPPVVKPPPVTKPPVVTVPPPGTKKLRYVAITPWPTLTSTLSGIAKKYYGNGNRWPEIYNVNKAGFRRPDGSMGWITNPNVIYAGRTVYVP